MKTWGLSLLIMLGLAAPFMARAASVSYGNFGPVEGTTFLGVAESSEAANFPFFHEPTLFDTGLDFADTTFDPVSAGGGVNTRDGVLVTTVFSPGGITAVAVAGNGLYTIAGTGSQFTEVVVNFVLTITVTQIDGVNVTPVVLTEEQGAVEFNLQQHAAVAAPWSLETPLDVAGQLSTLGFSGNATGIEVSWTVFTGASSEAASIGNLETNDLKLTVTALPVPEPAGMILAATGVAVMLGRRRNFSRQDAKTRR